jgi:prepilin-type processing-associated H-X9-DG protein
VQRVRESNARLTCQNNLKQLGLGFYTYHNDYGVFPKGGTYNPVDALTNPLYVGIDPMTGYDWGSQHSRPSRGSWLFHLLPYISEGNFHNFMGSISATRLGDVVAVPVEPDYLNLWYSQPEPVRWARRSGSSMHDIANGMAGSQSDNPFRKSRIRTLRCPSDVTKAPSGDLEGLRCNYVGVFGPGCPFENCGSAATFRANCENTAWGLQVGGIGNERTNDPGKVPGMFNWGGVDLRLIDVQDGASNTMMLGEIIMNQNARVMEMWNQTGWVDAKSWINLGYTNIPINHFTPLDYTDAKVLSSNTSCSGTNDFRSACNRAVSLGFKSEHGNGVNFLFVDGSSRMVSQYIQQETYTYLSMRNDAQPVPSLD